MERTITIVTSQMTAELLNDGQLGAKDAKLEFHSRLIDTDVNVVVTTQSDEEMDAIVFGANFITKLSRPIERVLLPVLGSGRPSEDGKKWVSPTKII